MAADLLVIQHTAYAGLGRLAPALQAAGCAADVRRIDRGEPLPTDLDDHDGLVVLGGPQAVWTDTDFPTRGAELALVANALSRARPLLGICLGAQLLAYAAGAECYRGDAPEIGWALLPSAHGKGLATEGVRAVVAWGDVHFGPRHTVCLISPENAASIRVADKCGYREYARTSYKGSPTVLFERNRA